LIFPTLFIVLVSYAITPDIKPDDDQDLREYYMARRGPIFLGLTAFVTMAQIADVVILGAGFSPIGTGLIVILLIPAFTINIWGHSAEMLINAYVLFSNALTTSIIIGS